MMAFDAIDAVWWPYLFIVLAGFLPNEVWRWLGVAAAGRLDEDTQVFAFVRAIATALVAGVIAQLIVAPSGALANVPFWLRLLAAGIGFGAMEAAGQKGWVGILVAELVLLVGIAHL